MKLDVISLLPSKALRERILEEQYVFSEKDMLLILYRYARAHNERLALLSRFAEEASEAYATLARRIAAWEKEKLAHFQAPTQGFLYELCIKDVDADWEEPCLCNTYEAAIAAIDAYFSADSASETDPLTFEIRKRPITAQGMPWPKENPAQCRIDAHGRVLLVEDGSTSPTCPPIKKCVECENFCLYDDVTFPFFVAAGTLVRYTSNHYANAKIEYGICPDDFDRGACSHIYVYPLDSDAVRYCLTSMEARTCSHEHIPAPLCDIVSPDDIPEELRASAAAFWAAYQAR